MLKSYTEYEKSNEQKLKEFKTKQKEKMKELKQKADSYD